MGLGAVYRKKSQLVYGGHSTLEDAVHMVHARLTDYNTEELLGNWNTVDE